jgi:hypothetical protein
MIKGYQLSIYIPGHMPSHNENNVKPHNATAQNCSIHLSVQQPHLLLHDSTLLSQQAKRCYSPNVIRLKQHPAAAWQLPVHPPSWCCPCRLLAPGVACRRHRRHTPWPLRPPPCLPAGLQQQPAPSKCNQHAHHPRVACTHASPFLAGYGCEQQSFFEKLSAT